MRPAGDSRCRRTALLLSDEESEWDHFWPFLPDHRFDTLPWLVFSVSIEVIFQFAALAVVASIGVCVVYAIFEMRRSYAEQRDRFVRAISTVEKFHKLQPEIIALLRSVESDGHALQEIARQMASSLSGAADRQTALLEELRDYRGSQEQGLLKFIESVSERLRALSYPQPPNAVLPSISEPKPENGVYFRLRKEVVSREPQLRFSLLKDWISTNALAISYRVSRGWNTANDLIANIPPYLEAEAEIASGCVLVIGTREHAERLAIPIRDLDSSCDLTAWFETPPNGDRNRHIPAVLIRSNGQFELISKGTSAS